MLVCAIVYERFRVFGEQVSVFLSLLPSSFFFLSLLFFLSLIYFIYFSVFIIKSYNKFCLSFFYSTLPFYKSPTNLWPALRAALRLAHRSASTPWKASSIWTHIHMTRIHCSYPSISSLLDYPLPHIPSPIVVRMNYEPSPNRSLFSVSFLAEILLLSSPVSFSSLPAFSSPHYSSLNSFNLLLFLCLLSLVPCLDFSFFLFLSLFNSLFLAPHYKRSYSHAQRLKEKRTQ